MDFKELPDDIRLKIYDAVYGKDEQLGIMINEHYDSFKLVANALKLRGYTEEEYKKDEMFILANDVEGLIVFGKKKDGSVGSELIDSTVTFPSSVIIEVEGKKGIQVAESPQADLEKYNYEDIVNHMNIVVTLQRLESRLLFIPVKPA